MKNLRGISITPLRMALINNWTIPGEEHSSRALIMVIYYLVILDVLVNDVFDRAMRELNC